MTICIICNKAKYWFQFYSIFMGTHTSVYDICKSCANGLRDRAVRDYWDKHLDKQTASRAG